MSGNLFSVIIPTMWYSDKINENLSRLNDCDDVGEIILIDNNTSLKPYNLDYSKLTYLPQEENIFVNPAWNLGVELSVYKNLCISNDDVIFNTDIFRYIEPYLGEGIWGMSTGNYYNNNPNLKYQVNKIQIRPWGWGCLFFIHKDNWTPIDERLKIACGDDWLIHHTKGGMWEIQNLILGDDKVSTTAIKSQFFGQQQEDIKLWSQYLHSLTKGTNS